MLQHLRTQMNLNQTDVIGKVPGIGSGSTLSRYENAGTKLDEDTVVALCRFYRAPESVIEETAALVRQSLQQGWWASYSDVVGETLAHLVALETNSKTVRTYQQITIPGMLQTASYARAVMHGFHLTHANEKQRRSNERSVSRRLEVRQQRQSLLDQDNAPKYQALITEAVLTQPLGGRRVMREQLRYLFNMAENRTKVFIRILPNAMLARGGAMHPAMTLFKPHHNDTGQMVYLEHHNQGGIYLLEPTEVERYQASLEDLWDRAGTRRETLDLLAEHIDQLVDNSDYSDELDS
ncbi:helix-turn-helix transcriptional regulator [Streptomyces sp. NBC_00825]|uniref:helix-turn-helix domain-containing protein n=1 Tax=unclassified Streptomyces TaxID=2593676 RepID=UPI002ED3A9F4|nr:helix-turn-helix transcriptional regulator [Streptomyces sp. NBC_00826]WTH89284.1 helix-turn-helix transcriptional regulator [Streptomyces sp. NBC_00825]WTH98009.1 helix-turn-helix transcriptional regulator [Streptomyces sp. NBC_00822]